MICLFTNDPEIFASNLVKLSHIFTGCTQNQTEFKALARCRSIESFSTDDLYAKRSHQAEIDICLIRYKDTQLNRQVFAAAKISPQCFQSWSSNPRSYGL
jgi:hypothetical protein